MGRRARVISHGTVPSPYATPGVVYSVGLVSVDAPLPRSLAIWEGYVHGTAVGWVRFGSRRLHYRQVFGVKRGQQLIMY
jgi:hypothetical protein